MYTVQLDEAQAALPELIHRAAQGEDVIITCANGTAVRLVPIAHEARPRFGSARGMFTMAEDFDAPLEDFSAWEQ